MSQVEPLQVPDPEWISRYHEALKRWYAQHKRDLPWRRTDDPYAVWISEMMLQQTQVAQARPYFERFMARFPTVHSLAVAPMADILKLWEGLGYYARARNMGRAAKQIVAEFDGRTPDELTDLLKLPGIGPYTAAAVLSIAYGKNHAVVDGNVVRVLCRLMNLQNRPDTAQTRSLLSSLADQLLEQGAAADYNQAIMELGATVCVPKNPKCGICPVKQLCKGFAELEDPSVLPAKKPKKQRPHYTETAALIWRNNNLLIVRRPEKGLLGGLWEFPGCRVEPGEAIEASLRAHLLRVYGLAVSVCRPLASPRHAFTHFSITLHGIECDWLSGDPPADDERAVRWVDLSEMGQLAFPKAQNRLIDALKRHGDDEQLRLL